jgi:carbonic anhydrase
VTIEDKLKELSEAREKLFLKYDREINETEKFFDGQKNILFKLQVNDEQSSKVREQINAIEKEKETEKKEIERQFLQEAGSIYDQMKVVIDLISSRIKERLKEL